VEVDRAKRRAVPSDAELLEVGEGGAAAGINQQRLRRKGRVGVRVTGDEPRHRADAAVLGDAGAGRWPGLWERATGVEARVEGVGCLANAQAEPAISGHIDALAQQRREKALTVEGVERHDRNLAVGVAARRMQED